MSELKSRAIRLLTRREHTASELAAKLSAHGSREEIDMLIADLQASGLLSDARYAESYLRGNAARFGAARLRQTLLRKGVAAETTAAQIAAAGLPDELERARTVWAKKFSAAPADARNWARQARFLQARGFAVEVIRRLLKEPIE